MGTSFRAFVSYCHADRIFAAKLQRRLESYRLPKRLVREANPGGIGDRIGPIFRDRADLSAAEDLSAAVYSAIAASTTLVVVASPDAAKSRWVEREIALFRELHPQAPVLVALARGEVAEGLPASFLSAKSEPLAADFRAEGDGPRLAFLKIVAAIAGLPLDALVQRDAQRRLRRVTAVTLSALLLALVMGAVAALALVSQAQAVRERKQAEGLIEFMLTDLRERLKSVGRLDVMERVNARAIDYYAAQGDLSQLPDESLLRRARLLHAMGEDDSAADDKAGALTKFREAYRVTAHLLARKPNDTDRILGHGQSEFWIGSAAWDAGDLATARPHFSRYAELSRQLVAIDPRNKDWQMEAGYAESNLGTVALQGDKQPGRALIDYRRALVHFEAARKLAPSDAVTVRELAKLHAWLADAARALGDLDRAFDERLQERALLTGLAARDPGNAGIARNLIQSAIGLARIEAALGRQDEATARLSAAMTAADALAARDPQNQTVAKLGQAMRIRLATLLPQGAPAARRIRTEALHACAGPDVVSPTSDLKSLCDQLRSGVSAYPPSKTGDDHGRR